MCKYENYFFKSGESESRESPEVAAYCFYKKAV